VKDADGSLVIRNSERSVCNYETYIGIKGSMLRLPSVSDITDLASVILTYLAATSLGETIATTAIVGFKVIQGYFGTS